MQYLLTTIANDISLYISAKSTNLSLDPDTMYKSIEVKSGNFGQQVNSDIRLQTVKIQMRPSHQDFHCLLS